MKTENKTKRSPTSVALTVLLIILLAPAISAMADTVTLFPNAAGDLTQLTPEPPGSVNWENMTTDDGDGSFLEMAATGDWRTDLYNLENPGVSGTINSVCIYVKARAGDSPAEQTGLRISVKTEASIYYGDEEFLTVSYEPYDKLYTVNPSTGLAWTWDQVEALQAGASLRRSRTSPGIKWSRATQLWVVVDYTPSVYEGKSHGYWKNHTESWPATGYSPSQTLASVFSASASLGLGDYTLLQALSFQGGSTLEEKAQLLLLQAVAALLNAAHPNINYPLTVAEIITQVNAALGGDAPGMETLKDTLDGYNNLGADLSS